MPHRVRRHGGPDMVALRGRDVDIFLKAPDPARPIILLYGPDAGLVRERADALAASAVDDPSDPFSLVRLAGRAPLPIRSRWCGSTATSLPPSRRGWSRRR